MVLETLTHATSGEDIDSTGDLLSTIREYDNKVVKNETDGVKVQENVAHKVEQMSATGSNKLETVGGDKLMDKRNKSLFEFNNSSALDNGPIHQNPRFIKLRNMKNRKSKLPNLKAKLEAGAMLDLKFGNTPIPNLQKQ